MECPAETEHFPSSSKTSPVIVGDLHAQVDNLLKILSENCLLDCLRLKTATLVILGDAIHSENANELDKFDTSMLMMDLIIRLKLQEFIQLHLIQKVRELKFVLLFMMKKGIWI